MREEYTYTIDVPGFRLRTQPIRPGLKGAWMIQARITKDIRRKVGLFWLATIGRKFPAGPPYHVKFTRISPGKPDLSNVVHSFKAVQDEVSARLGVDDGDELRVTFGYAREKGPHGIRIAITGYIVHRPADAVPTS